MSKEAISELYRVDSQSVESTRSMGLSILHFVFLFDETSSLLVCQLRVRPASIRVASFAETRLGLEGVIDELAVDLILEIAGVDPLEMVLLGGPSGLSGSLGLFGGVHGCLTSGCHASA